MAYRELAIVKSLKDLSGQMPSGGSGGQASGSQSSFPVTLSWRRVTIAPSRVDEAVVRSPSHPRIYLDYWPRRTGTPVSVISDAEVSLTNAYIAVASDKVLFASTPYVALQVFAGLTGGAGDLLVQKTASAGTGETAGAFGVLGIKNVSTGGSYSGGAGDSGTTVDWRPISQQQYNDNATWATVQGQRVAPDAGSGNGDGNGDGNGGTVNPNLPTQIPIFVSIPTLPTLVYQPTQRGVGGILLDATVLNNIVMETPFNSLLNNYEQVEHAGLDYDIIHIQQELNRKMILTLRLVPNQ